MTLAAAAVLVAAGVVAFNVGGVRERLFGAAAPQIDSLAVLPLKNLSGDPEQEYFVEGMHEALTAELSKISALKVISRTSAMQYKDVKKPMPQIARELGVTGLIEGSVAREGDQVRVTVQLIHGPTDKHLWAESYQREVRSILVLQSDVARAIANQIRIKLRPQEQTRLARARPVNPAAHEAYLKGRFFWNKRTPNDLKKSLEYFQQAVAEDPKYALGYAGMADAYGLLGYVGYGALAPKEAFPKAKAAALKALELDSQLAEAHAALAYVRWTYDWDWRGGEEAFERAIALNPNYATAHQWFGMCLANLGRFEEGLAALRRAQELDPLSLIIRGNLARVYTLARRPDDALEQIVPTLEMDPNFAPTYNFLAEAYIQKGMHAEAIAAMRKNVELAPTNPGSDALLAYTYAVAGEKSEARQLLERLKRSAKQRYVPPEWFAVVHGALGERDAAFAWLEKAYQERSGLLPMLKVHPLFDNLRDDPRFDDLLRRMNFPE